MDTNEMLRLVLRNQLVIMRALEPNQASSRHLLEERKLETAEVVGFPGVPNRCHQCTSIVLEAGICEQCRQGM
jgi:hypothetical protein